MEIQKRLQTQQSSQAEWRLLEWSSTTLEMLPPTMDEMSWDLNLHVPPPFEPNAEAANVPVIDEVKKCNLKNM